MDSKRKKELIAAYRDRCPEMGVIALCCKETGERFLGVSTDTKAGFNSICAKLAGGWHPNRHLQELWNRYGQEGFEQTVVEKLRYEDPHEDHTAALEALRAKCLAADPGTVKIWR